MWSETFWGSPSPDPSELNILLSHFCKIFDALKNFFLTSSAIKLSKHWNREHFPCYTSCSSVFLQILNQYFLLLHLFLPRAILNYWSAYYLSLYKHHPKMLTLLDVDITTVTIYDDPVWLFAFNIKLFR